MKYMKIWNSEIITILFYIINPTDFIYFNKYNILFIEND